MKTASKKTIETKLAKLVSAKEVNKSSIIYGWVIEIINGNKNFRPVYSQGSSWKHSSLFDRRDEFTILLRKLGIEFKQGNDAPRGGQTGAFLNIITKIK